MGELAVHQTYRVQAMPYWFPELMAPEIHGLKTSGRHHCRLPVLKKLPEPNEFTFPEKVVEGVCEIQNGKNCSPVVIYKKSC